MKAKITQKGINNIWSKEWKKQKEAAPQMIFGHRLFVEGYPIFKKYIPKDAKLILDVGGGSGRYGLKLAQDFSESKVFVTDVLQESLSLVDRLVKELDIKNIKTQKENVLKLSFPDNYFDVVFSDGVIQHLPNYKKAISEMYRVLNPGGLLIISAANRWNPHTFYKWLSGKKYLYGYEKSFKKKELRRLFLDSKLKVVAEDGFYFGYGIFRLKYIHKIFRFLGRVSNRLSKIIDSFTKRFVSRNFGFLIIIVGKK